MDKSAFVGVLSSGRTFVVQVGLGYSPVWLWSCYQHYKQRDMGGLTPIHALFLAIDPEVICDQALLATVQKPLEVNKPTKLGQR